MKQYFPLVVLFFTAFLIAFSFFLSVGGTMHFFMHLFMGTLFCQFSMLKLFDLKGFAEGYQKYDWMAQKSKVYAHTYPFLELFLGLGFLTFFMPYLVYMVTILLMLEGIVSVISALFKGLDVKCACMGTSLNVPVSTVTLSEDLFMLLMTALLLLT